VTIIGDERERKGYKPELLQLCDQAGAESQDSTTPALQVKE